MKFIILLASVAVYATFVEGALQLTECSEDPLPREVRFNDCHGTSCTVKAGDPVNLEIDFTALYPSKELQLKAEFVVQSFLGSVAIEKNIDGLCDLLRDNHCPLENNQNYTLSASPESKIPDAAKGYDPDIVARLVDENDNVHFCFVFQINIPY